LGMFINVCVSVCVCVCVYWKVIENAMLLKGALVPSMAMGLSRDAKHYMCA